MQREYYKKYELTPKASLKPKPTICQKNFLPVNKQECVTNKDFWSNIGTDEILIGALILALITDDDPDFLIIAALVFILLS